MNLPALPPQPAPPVGLISRKLLWQNLPDSRTIGSIWEKLTIEDPELHSSPPQQQQLEDHQDPLATKGLETQSIVQSTREPSRGAHYETSLPHHPIALMHFTTKSLSASSILSDSLSFPPPCGTKSPAPTHIDTRLHLDYQVGGLQVTRRVVYLGSNLFLSIKVFLETQELDS